MKALLLGKALQVHRKATRFIDLKGREQIVKLRVNKFAFTLGRGGLGV